MLTPSQAAFALHTYTSKDEMLIAHQYTMHLQLFAQSGLETAELAHMENLSNHMGLFLQVSLTLRGTYFASPWSQNNMQVLTYPSV